jgi:TRAP-type C4-dicarboxylate transport system permease small subunit
MTIRASATLALGVLVTLLAVVGLAASRYYQPTMFTRSSPEQPVTGWKRTAALMVMSPIIAVALVLRAIGVLKTVDERHSASRR